MHPPRQDYSIVDRRNNANGVVAITRSLTNDEGARLRYRNPFPIILPSSGGSPIG